MQAILGLLPGETVRPIEESGADLLAHVGRQAMEYHGVGVRQPEEVGVDAIRLEVPEAAVAVSSWPMLDPDVRVHGISVTYSLSGIQDQ